MHSTNVVALTAPPQFLKKLWKLVDDPVYNDVISWGPDGTTFIIKNQAQFAKDVLPMYFKHNKIASFIRQLNMYGFSKVANIEQGGLKSERDDLEFHHDEGFFVKGQEDLLALIKRKISVGKAQDQTVSKSTGLNQFLIDVSHLKNKHDSMESSLAKLKRENEVVWRELGTLRQKYSTQQKIINQMIHFLARMFHGNSSRGVAAKRKMPLMITEPERESKSARFTLDDDALSTDQVDSPACGPVIHDVTDTEGIDSKPFILVDPTSEDPVNEISSVLQELVEPKQEATIFPDYNKDLLSDTLNSCDIPSTSTDIPTNEQSETNNSQSTVAIRTPNELADHVGNTQTELDTLRELLQSNFGIDASTILDLYNLPDDIVQPCSSFLDDINDDKNEVTGTELVQYNPSLLELVDDDSNFFPSTTHDSDIEDLAGFGRSTDYDLPDLPESDTLNTPETDLLVNDIFKTPDPILPNVSRTAKKPT